MFLMRNKKINFLVRSLNYRPELEPLNHWWIFVSPSVTDAMYEVTLVRENLDGQSSSAATEFYTSDAPLPPPPGNLHVTYLSMTSMNVEWYQPSSDIEILHYTIKYYEMVGDKIGNPKLQTRYTCIYGLFLLFWYNKTGLEKQFFPAYNCKYFLTHLFKYISWLLKRTVSLRWFFWVPTTCFGWAIRIFFLLHTLN